MNKDYDIDKEHLEGFYGIEDMSVRVYNVCYNNQLKCLSDILKYYKINGSFQKLRNCGIKSNDELIAIVKKYNEGSDYKSKEETNCKEKVTDWNLNNELLIDLKLRGEISVYLYNLCIDNGLKFLWDILFFYKENHSFLSLKDFTDKSNEELIEIARKYWLRIGNNNKEISHDEIEVLKQESKDILLSNLRNNEEISVRSYNVCIDNDLHSLSDIILYYEREDSFLNLRNCGVKSNNELIELVNEYSGVISDKGKIITNTDETVLEEGFKDKALLILRKRREISVHSYDVCIENDLFSLSEIANFYKENYSFLSLRNCSKKSNNELIEIVKEYWQNIPKKDNKNNIEILSIYHDLSAEKKIMVSRYYDLLIQKLSVRANKVLVKTISIKKAIDLIEYLLVEKERLSGLINEKNVGIRTINEIIFTGNQLEILIHGLSKSNEYECNKVYLKIILNDVASDLNININDFVNSVLDINGKIKLFALINRLIINFEQTKKKRNEIISELFDDGEKAGKAKISKRLGVTIERVRQLLISKREEVKNQISFIKELNVDLLRNMFSLREQNYHIIDSRFVSEINKDENLTNNLDFYGLVCSQYFMDDFDVLIIESVKNIADKMESESSIKCIYLIKKELTNRYNFEAFYQSVKELIDSKVTQDCELHFKGYLDEYLNNDAKINNDIYEICESILYNGFDIVVSINGYIIIKRNTPKILEEYCYDLLERVGSPMTINEIFKELSLISDNKKIKPGSLQSRIHMRKDMFICFSRTSTYGLKKWEKDKENIRGGTIKEMVIEYLETKQYPVHVRELANYISKYRKNVTPKSIYANMKLDKYGYFIDYKCGFLGLKNQVYLDFKPNKIKGFLFTKDRLKEYNGYKLNDFINMFCKKYGYLKVQIESVVQEMQEDRKIIITAENKMVIL